MKKAELKNRLRRRTADKLYDFDRSTGRMPVHLPGIASSPPARDLTRRPPRVRSKRPPDRIPGR